MLPELKGLEDALHDAWIDLGTVSFQARELVINGYIDRPVRMKWLPRRGMFPVEIRITAVDDFKAEDDEDIGWIPIERVSYDVDPARIVFEGSIPGRLIVYGRRPEVTFSVASFPTHTRRLGRWVPVRSCSHRETPWPPP